MKPGPLISAAATGPSPDSSASRAATAAAISRGGRPSALASGRATFDW